MSDTAQFEKTAAAFSTNVEESAERIRALNEKLIDAAKQNGTATLDAYEKTLANLVDLEQKAADASQLDWVSALAKAHTSFITEVSTAFTTAARDVLK